MPRYVYYCKACDDHFQVSHGMKEMQESCQLCNESDRLVRVPQMPVLRNSERNEKKKVGATVKEHIEENRKILLEQKKQARNQKYDN